MAAGFKYVKTTEVLVANSASQGYSSFIDGLVTFDCRSAPGATGLDSALVTLQQSASVNFLPANAHRVELEHIVYATLDADLINAAALSTFGTISSSDIPGLRTKEVRSAVLADMNASRIYTQFRLVFAPFVDGYSPTVTFTSASQAPTPTLRLRYVLP